MKDCIFCKIIEGTLPSKTIYEDNLIKVIMNINPSTNSWFSKIRYSDI